MCCAAALRWLQCRAPADHPSKFVVIRANFCFMFYANQNPRYGPSLPYSPSSYPSRYACPYVMDPDWQLAGCTEVPRLDSTNQRPWSEFILIESSKVQCQGDTYSLFRYSCPYTRDMVRLLHLFEHRHAHLQMLPSCPLTMLARPATLSPLPRPPHQHQSLARTLGIGTRCTCTVLLCAERYSTDGGP